MREEKKPTALEDVIIDLLMNGSDRGVLVRPEQEGARMAVLVLMLSGAARARLGPALQPVMDELGNAKTNLLLADSGLDERSALTDIFGGFDDAPHGWVWFEFCFGRTDVLAAGFVGPVCERVAKICTECGAPCSLDPKKPAPGYEIVERKNG